ncbi:MAG: AAA family ATPase [Candidatus Competibacteraceae bacterium]|nr:AAA family ATPase [Candidatus Competibacteraceae bacterium]
MKIEHLYLKAFGAFSERRLDFTGGPDFHVIYGPNEAGKSTTLDALIGLLFGIEERTPYNFIHANPHLRIGAALATADAGRLAVMRRKGRKQTLFALDEGSGEEWTDQPLAEDVLTRLLGGLDEALYRALFGLNLDGLTRGGKELLDGKGEVGHSLFAAAAGLADLRQLSNRLETEASKLFRPRASTSEIQVALKDLEEQRKRAREATVRTSAWEQAERTKRQAEKHHADLRAELHRWREEQRRLSRIVSHLPLTAERAAKLQEMAALAMIPLLPPEAGQQRIEAEERLRTAIDTQREAQAVLDEGCRQREQWVVREALLNQADAIERLHHVADDYRGALERLPRIEADLAATGQTLVEQLAEIDPALVVDLASAKLAKRIRALAPSPTMRARVQALLEEHGNRSVQDEQLAERERELSERLQRFQEELKTQPASMPFADLEQEREQVTASGDLTGQHAQLTREIAELETALVREAASMWDGSFDELIVLRVPPLATVTEMSEHLRRWAEHEGLLKDRDETLRHDLQDRERELRALAATGELVTHDQVRQARQVRDDRWREVRRSWVERMVDPNSLTMEQTPGVSLADAFEQTLREADRLADLLHADAERATHVANLRQRIAEMRRARSKLAEEFAEWAAERDRLDSRWKAVATALRQPDLSPGAAAEWLQKRTALVERFTRLEALRRQRREIGTALVAVRQNLERALRACDLPGLSEDETLSAALVRAKAAIERGRQDAMARVALSDKIRQCEAERYEVTGKRAKLAEDQAIWREQWNATLSELRLPPQSLPAEARVRLDQWDRIAQTLGALETLMGEVRREREMRSRFESALTELACAVSEPVAGRAADQVAGVLYQALGEARDADQRRKRIDDAMTRERQRFEQAKIAAANQNNRLAELARRAGAEVPDDLAAIEEQAARKRHLSERIAEIEEQLVRDAGCALGEVLAEVEQENLDAARARLDALESSIRERETEVESAHAAYLEARRAFDAIDGGDVAACALQETEGISARIVKQSRAYARARLAGAVVSRVVQAYLERHQGPVLRRASEIFARITLGSFSSLEMDYQDDRQILVGQRPDKVKVGMDGLSQGTRDQLFLALRIAAIEEHLREREAVPIAIDDLLVQFDDDRAVATLGVLAELARRAQVLFFTHHGHLCELAAAALPPDVWRRHDLSADPTRIPMAVQP